MSESLEDDPDEELLLDDELDEDELDELLEELEDELLELDELEESLEDESLELEPDPLPLAPGKGAFMMGLSPEPER